MCSNTRALSAQGDPTLPPFSALDHPRPVFSPLAPWLRGGIRKRHWDYPDWTFPLFLTASLAQSTQNYCRRSILSLHMCCRFFLSLWVSSHRDQLASAAALPLNNSSLSPP